jgi:WW domain
MERYSLSDSPARCLRNERRKEFGKGTKIHLFAFLPLRSHLSTGYLTKNEPANHNYNQDTIQQSPSSATDSQLQEQEFQPWDPLSVIDHKADLLKVADRISELKKLLWMHVMVRDPQAHQDQLDRLAWYVETQYHNIMVDWPTDYVNDARVAWVDLPSFKSLKDNQGRVLAPRPIDLALVLPDPWLTNITLRGETYYWNPQTLQSQWEHPATGQTTEKR